MSPVYARKNLKKQREANVKYLPVKGAKHCSNCKSKLLPQTVPALVKSHGKTVVLLPNLRARHQLHSHYLVALQPNKVAWQINSGMLVLSPWFQQLRWHPLFCSFDLERMARLPKHFISPKTHNPLSFCWSHEIAVKCQPSERLPSWGKFRQPPFASFGVGPQQWESTSRQRRNR